MSRTQVFRFRRQGNAIRLYEIGKDLLVPCFLETLDLDRPPQQWVFDSLGIAKHPQACVAFSLHCDVPDRQADEPVARLGLEDRPIDSRWSVGVVGVDQHAAEGPLVPLATKNDRPSFAGFPYPGSAVGGPDHRVIQGEPPF